MHTAVSEYNYGIASGIPDLDMYSMFDDADNDANDDVVDADTTVPPPVEES